MRRNHKRSRFSQNRNRNVDRGLFGMDQRDEPCWSRRRIIIVVGHESWFGRLRSNDISLLADADMPQAVEVPNGLVEPRLGIRRFIQADNQRAQEFSGQAYDALIFSLDARPCFQHQAHDVDGKAKQKHQRQNDVEPSAQRQFLPHELCPESSRTRVRIWRTLTDQKSDDLIETYSTTVAMHI